MITIDKAIEIIKTNLPPEKTEKISISEALGRTLAEDILAPEPSPRYTNSAMDGFAVRWQDVSDSAQGSEISLEIIGESQAGIPFLNCIKEGQAVRISTGAMLPEGADTVVRVEDTTEENSHVRILAVRKQGQDIRYKGEEFHQGDLLLSRGTKLSAPQIGLQVAVGIDTVSVYRHPEVALLVTGSEFAASGEAVKEHQIRDSNSAMLESVVSEAGGMVCLTRRVHDNLKSTVDAIQKVRADIILCSGGVSVGRHDHVKEAAEQNGFEPLFWRIRQKPGKPLYCAKKGETLLFGLPGNPVSAYMCFIHYIRPILAALSGHSFRWPMVTAQTLEDITNNGTRTNLIRVRLQRRPNEGFCITKAEKQGSHMLTSLVNADGYIILEPGKLLASGSRTDVYRL